MMTVFLGSAHISQPPPPTPTKLASPYLERQLREVGVVDELPGHSARRRAARDDDRVLGVGAHLQEELAREAALHVRRRRQHHLYDTKWEKLVEKSVV